MIRQVGAEGTVDDLMYWRVSVFRLEEKIAAVTGAGSGIGAATAQMLARAGAMVYLLERDAAAGASIVERIRAEGGQAELIVTDVSHEAACEQAAARILSAHGRCDVLINNAGIGHVEGTERGRERNGDAASLRILATSPFHSLHY